MKIHYGFTDLAPIPAPVVSVGSFDGVHRGHRLLIRQMNEIAHENGGESVLVTFDPHPRQFLRGDNRLLTTLDEKLILLEEAGLNNVIIVDFNEKFSRVEGGEFIEKYLKGILRAHTIVTGEGHHFGHDRSGNETLVRQAGFRSLNLGRYQGISSTNIRDAIEKGDMKSAAEMLGGSYLILAPVAERSKLLPPPGEYLAEVDGNAATPCRIDRRIFASPEESVRILG